MNIWLYVPWKKAKDYQLHAYMNATDRQFRILLDTMGLIEADGGIAMIEWDDEGGSPE